MAAGVFQVGSVQLPNLILRAGDRAARRFVEFFAATIRNRNTRAAYAQAVGRFCHWCEGRGLDLASITPVVVAAYIEGLMAQRSAPTVKQHLAAIRMLFDFLVTGHVVDVNPAWSVRGPRHVVKKGKTPVLTAAEARQLLDSIETDTLIGLRDRALIAVMCYSFARVSATVAMNIEDYYQQGKRSWFRLHEKGGKFHEVPAHHNADGSSRLHRRIDVAFPSRSSSGRRLVHAQSSGPVRSAFRRRCPSESLRVAASGEAAAHVGARRSGAFVGGR